jgi:hypothetical protein
MPENFAPDATQLPTGCQPESLAKPARGRSHKAAQPQLLTRRASSTIIRLRQKTSQSRDTASAVLCFSPVRFLQRSTNLFTSVTLQIRFSAPLSRSYNRWGWGMVSHFINEPEHWLARAEEARMLANQMNDAEAKVAMLRIAEDYERLAQRAEGRALGRLPNSN